MLQSNKLKETVDALLLNRLNKFLQQPLNNQVCLEIYSEIFLTVQEIVLAISTLKNNMSEDAVNFVAQAYYDLIELQGGNKLDPNIFTKRVKANDMSNKDIMYCTMFLKGTDVLAKLVSVIKKRS